MACCLPHRGSHTKSTTNADPCGQPALTAASFSLRTRSFQSAFAEITNNNNSVFINRTGTARPVSMHRLQLLVSLRRDNRKGHS